MLPQLIIYVFNMLSKSVGIKNLKLNAAGWSTWGGEDRDQLTYTYIF